MKKKPIHLVKGVKSVTDFLSDANLMGADLSNANLNEANSGLDILLMRSEIFDKFEKAIFDFVYFNQERLDRRTALQRLREIQDGKPGSAEAL